MRRPYDRVMRIQLEIEGEVWHIINSYAPQTGCPQDENDTFWEHMDSEMHAVTRSERVVVAGYINGHVGIDRAGYNNVHGGHGHTDWMWLMRMAYKYWILQEHTR